MLTEEEIRQDLAKLKDIVIAHKAPEAELAIHPETINGQDYEVFTNAPRNLSELYELGLAEPDETFLVYLDERFSFAETLEMSRRMSRVLIEQYGIQHGDRVAVCARNSPEWCFAYMAATIVGAVIVPMNSWWKGAEIEYGLSDSGTKLVFFDHSRYQQILPYIDSLKVDLIQIKPEAGSSFPEFYSLIENVAPLNNDEITALNVNPEDNASIMYTSGSTGMPKGVLSTHRNIINALYTLSLIHI